MKAAVVLVVCLAALASAGSSAVKNQQQPQVDATQTTQLLQKWCWASQLSQPELQSTFKKVVGAIKSNPDDKTLQSIVMDEQICHQAKWSSVASSATSKEAAPEVDPKAHELVKDVYMDALIACNSEQCSEKLVEIIDSDKVDSVRASYYMTRIAIAEKKDQDVASFAKSFIKEQQTSSEAIDRQRLFAVTALIGKAFDNQKQTSGSSSELKQTAQQVVKTIVDRYIKPVAEQEVQQYLQQSSQQQSAELAKKIAKRSAALKALANIPAYIWAETADAKEIIVAIASNKQEMTTARQSAIECLEQTDAFQQQLKQIAFDQEEPTEVRIAALRAIMTSGQSSSSSSKPMIAETIEQLVKHCNQPTNQQQDDQFVLYAISYLENLSTSQQPEHKEAKEAIVDNKQSHLKLLLLNKKFQHKLADVRQSSRNYKLEQEFQMDSGLMIEGDIIYESQYKKQQQDQGPQILPKLLRFNMSMPVMGETVNVLEVSIRQNAMNEELLSALKMVSSDKFNSQSVGKVVDAFKSTAQKQQPQSKQQSAEADLSIKVDGYTVVYLCADDFKSTSTHGNQISTRSTHNIVDELIQYLKQNPVSFNRGFNFNVNVNERLAKLLDVEASLLAGLRFESRANGQSSNDFEVVIKAEPRFAFESIVGPAKLTSKKHLQRLSTKTAIGMRLRFKSNELVNHKIELHPCYTYENQMVEKQSTISAYSGRNSYFYLPELNSGALIFGAEDIYTPNYYSTPNYYYNAGSLTLFLCSDLGPEW